LLLFQNASLFVLGVIAPTAIFQGTPLRVVLPLLISLPLIQPLLLLGLSALLFEHLPLLVGAALIVDCAAGILRVLGLPLLFEPAARILTLSLP
jgi:hypothetical protein